jgi:hypothetical protein
LSRRRATEVSPGGGGGGGGGGVGPIPPSSIDVPHSGQIFCPSGISVEQTGQILPILPYLLFIFLKILYIYFALSIILKLNISYPTNYPPRTHHLEEPLI